VSSLVLLFAINRVAGKAFGDMFSVTFRRVLLMVKEEIDTARTPRVSSSSSETHKSDTYAVFDP
jgi:hypothetical protein